ncbi:MAG: hypothetical protein WKI04_03770 [Ferruginibacter sp.]
MPLKYNCLVIYLCSLIAGVTAQDKITSYNDPRISYEGRIAFTKDAAELSWPGTTATILFRGEAMSALLKDADTANYFNVIIDDTVIGKIHTDTMVKSYSLASGLPNGMHKLQLFKRTEWDKGKTWFYGFQASPETEILPAPVPKKRKIEFYGNSITCGYGIEDSSSNDSGSILKTTIFLMRQLQQGISMPNIRVSQKAASE